jgi:hypothetical protein
MSPRSAYLLDQAAKCEWHAKNLSDAETQKELRKLAKQYIEEAAALQTKETDVGPPLQAYGE